MITPSELTFGALKELINMGPRHSVNNSFYCTTADQEGACQFTNGVLTFFPFLSNPKHISHSQDVPSILFSNTSIVAMPAFGACIPVVVRARSKPEMGRIDARTIVSARAVMENTHAVLDNAMVNNPTCYMASYKTSSCSSSSDSQYANSPITFTFGTALPKPTGICFLNLGPKSILKRVRQCVVRKIRILVKFSRWASILANAFNGCIIGVHSNRFLLCRALGCFINAEAFLFSGNSLERQAN